MKPIRSVVVVAAVATVFLAMLPMTQAAAEPALRASASPVDFGSSDSSGLRVVRIHNDGSATTIDSTRASDGFSFSHDGCTGVTLHTGGSCSLHVRSLPLGSGTQTGEIVLDHSNGSFSIPTTATFDVPNHVFVGTHRSNDPMGPVASWLGTGIMSADASNTRLSIESVRRWRPTG